MKDKKTKIVIEEWYGSSGEYYIEIFFDKKLIFTEGDPNVSYPWYRKTKFSKLQEINNKNIKNIILEKITK